MAVLTTPLRTTRSTGIDVATIAIAASADAQMMEVYESSVSVNNDHDETLGSLTRCIQHGQFLDIVGSNNSNSSRTSFMSVQL
jgi:hypothetical protein